MLQLLFFGSIMRTSYTWDVLSITDIWIKISHNSINIECFLSVNLCSEWIQGVDTVPVLKVMTQSWTMMQMHK